MNNKRTFMIEALAIATLVATPLSANADEWRGGSHDHDGWRRGWYGSPRHFDWHDNDLWRSGGWRHVWHGGRFGWWWVVGGIWYFYPEPVYPYPDFYTPPVIVTPPAPKPSAPQPAAQYWYFCTSANGYYPYVASCPDGWKAVPATPPAAAPNAPPSPPPPDTPASGHTVAPNTPASGVAAPAAPVQ